MNDIDPNLQRLRELEARIAFAEHHIAEQRALVQRLARMGLRNSLAHELLRSMEDSLTILRLRHGDLLRGMKYLGGAGIPDTVPEAPAAPAPSAAPESES
ncbi:MAG TPA: hypothetical protein VF457_01690 [Burkholderiaceae bacterium]